jgi:prepilin-type N-terminal cleavage/methylation domain-containing protein
MNGDGFLIHQSGAGNKGFTLIELLVTLALVGIVISVYASLYYFGYKSYNSTQNNIDTEQNVRYAMTYIINQINQCPDKSQIIYKSGDSGIKIYDQNGNLNYINLDRNEHKLYAYGNKGNEIAVNIIDFKVTDKGNNILNIEITGQNKDGSGTFTLSTDVYIRK